MRRCHGHFAEQYPDGLVGPLIVTDAADAAAAAASGAPYSVDGVPWVFVCQDYYAKPAATLVPGYLSPASGGMEPMPDGLLVAGHFPATLVIPANASAGPVRLRLIAATTLSLVTFSLDGATLVLIELDGVAVSPLPLAAVSLHAGQRASVVVDWAKLVRARTLSGAERGAGGRPQAHAALSLAGPRRRYLSRAAAAGHVADPRRHVVRLDRNRDVRRRRGAYVQRFCIRCTARAPS